MLPEHKRTAFVQFLGEARTKQLEDLLADLAEMADKAGIEKKEKRPRTLAQVSKDLKGLLDEMKGKTKAAAPAPPPLAGNQNGLANSLHGVRK